MQSTLIILGIIGTINGALCFAFPYHMATLKRGCSCDYYEPSDDAVFMTKLVGGIMFVVCVICLVIGIFYNSIDWEGLFYYNRNTTDVYGDVYISYAPESDESGLTSAVARFVSFFKSFTPIPF